jgi:SPP1 family predicted phage head-tail adaptor
MKAMQAGKLKHLVQVQRDVGVSTDTVGSPVRAWQSVRTTWAAIEPLATSGRELLQGAQITADMTHKLTLRYRATPAITPAMRVLFGSRIFQIGGVAHTEELQRETLLYCKEQV